LQFAINGNLLKPRFKTEIELVLLNVRKSLIEIDTLSSKTKAHLLMTLDLYYANFNSQIIESTVEKIYQPYLLDNPNDMKNSVTNVSTQPVPLSTKRVEEKPLRVPTAIKSHQPPPSSTRQPAYDRRSERIPPKSPVKTTARPQQGRRLEPPRSITPTSYQQKPASPQKKVSPKELRARRFEKETTASHNHPKQSLNKVESAIDKLQIKSDTHSSNQRQNQPDTPPTSPTKNHVTNSSSSDENILKQQNSNGRTKSKQELDYLKVCLSPDNTENLSWNGSLENLSDDQEDTSPKLNKYSDSFMKYLKNKPSK
jgi:hypothetical protein